MLTLKVQLGYVLTRGWGQAVQGGLSCPPPRITERMDNPQILLHHLLQKYLVERDINIISINLRCSLQRFSWIMYWQGGGGQAVQGGLSCPPPRITERMDNPQILLHHLLQKYLVERDINIISINLRCSLQRFSWIMYWQGGGGQAVQGGLSCPPPRTSERIVNSPNFITPSTSEIFSWERYKLYFSQSEMLTSNVQLGYVLTRGWGASCPGRFILPPT